MIRGLVLFLGVVAVFLAVQAVITPGRAEAFLGESSVIDPATGKLTSAAEALLKQGKTLPEIIAEARSFGGAGAAGDALGVFEAAGLFPTVATMVGGFAAGFEIGSEVCGLLGISGCFHLWSEVGLNSLTATGAAVPEKGNWCWSSAAVNGGPTFSYYWRGGTTSCSGGRTTVPVAGDNPIVVEKGCTTYVAATGSTSSAIVEPGVWWCGSSSAKVFADMRAYWRSSMADNYLEFNGSDSPSIPNVSFSADSSWSKNAASAMTGSEAGEKVGQVIAHRLAPEIPSPYSLTVEVPDCDGLLYPACEELLEERGLKVTRVTRTWETAEPDGEPEEVLELDPKRGTEVEKGTAVKVVTNPDEKGMPLVVPSPGEGETYDEYITRLAPGLNPERKTRTMDTLDPKLGPDGVIGTSPAPGTRLNPSTEHDVRVDTNPDTAPPVGEVPGVGGSTCSATVPAVDLSPLNLNPGDKFPFGTVGFFVGWVGEWEFPETAPAWWLTIVPAGVFGVDDDIRVHVELAALAPIADAVRVAFLLLAFVGFLWFLGTAAMNLNGDAS